MNPFFIGSATSVGNSRRMNYNYYNTQVRILSTILVLGLLIVAILGAMEYLAKPQEAGDSSQNTELMSLVNERREKVGVAILKRHEGFEKQTNYMMQKIKAAGEAKKDVLNITEEEIRRYAPEAQYKWRKEKQK